MNATCSKGDAANSKRHLLIIGKVQMCLRASPAEVGNFFRVKIK